MLYGHGEISEACSKRSMLVDGVYHFLAPTDLWYCVHRDTSLRMKKYDLHKFSHISSSSQLSLCLLLEFLHSSFFFLRSSVLEEACCLR